MLVTEILSILILLLNALSKLTCNLYNDATGTVNAVNTQLKLELLIETKEKLRVY